MSVHSRHRTPYSGRCAVVILSLICFLCTSQLFTQDKTSAPQPLKQSGETKDSSAARHDTIPLPRVPPPTPFSPPHAAALSLVTARDLEWHDLQGIGDLLNEIPGFVNRTQSGAGQYNQAISGGIDRRGIAVLADGRILNDPATGIYNFFSFPFENTQIMEAVTGPSSFIYGFNGAGAVIRIETKDFLNIVPFSKIRYEESAYNYQLSDGSFSQNITRNTNLSLGFRHQSTDGRFDNSNYDSWNIRGRFRWSITPRMHLMLAERYESNQIGLNGGISLANTPSGFSFVPQRAVVVNPDAYERNTRHDVDLSLTARLLDDTTSLSSMHVYLTHSLREYRDEENRTTPNGIYVENDYRTQWIGVSASQTIKLAFQSLTFGGNIEGDRIDISSDNTSTRTTKFAVWGRDEVRLPANIFVGLFGRYDISGSRSAAGFGVDASIRLSKSWTFFGGTSIHQRIPAFMEADRIDTIIVRPGKIETEQHRLLQVGAVFSPRENAIVRFAFFHRRVERPITISPYGPGRGFPGVLIANDSPIMTQGIELSGRFPIGFIMLEGNALHLLRRSDDGLVLSDQPKLTAQGGVYYWDTLLDGKLALKAGFRGTYASGTTGPIFQPELLMYAGPAYAIGAGSRVDFLAIARIGDAYVHFVWENLTNVQYYGTPFYPILDRAIRFGVSWEFVN